MTVNPDPQGDAPEDEQERWQVLIQLEDWLERPMLILSFFWLILVLIELIWTTSGVFELVGTIIWIVFILEFLLRFAVTAAMRKLLHAAYAVARNRRPFVPQLAAASA